MVYITGSTGFIGSYLNKRVKAVSIPHKDIQSTDFSDATKVFFCSTYGNMSTHTDENEVIRANISDLLHVLQSINWDKIDSFVFISTSSVKLKFQTMYSRTKKAAEEILLGYMEKYNAPITIVRPFSVTGIGEQPQHLIPTLIRKISNNEAVELDPEPVHDFIDVEDVVNGILNLSFNKARGIYDLGTGVGIDNLGVLEIVEGILKKKAIVKEVHGLRPYDNDCWVSLNFRSRSYGWFPSKTLPQSIQEMVNASK